MKLTNLSLSSWFVESDVLNRMMSSKFSNKNDSSTISGGVRPQLELALMLANSCCTFCSSSVIGFVICLSMSTLKEEK